MPCRCTGRRAGAQSQDVQVPASVDVLVPAHGWRTGDQCTITLPGAERLQGTYTYGGAAQRDCPAITWHSLQGVACVDTSRSTVQCAVYSSSSASPAATLTL